MSADSTYRIPHSAQYAFHVSSCGTYVVRNARWHTAQVIVRVMRPAISGTNCENTRPACGCNRSLNLVGCPPLAAPARNSPWLPTACAGPPSFPRLLATGPSITYASYTCADMVRKWFRQVFVLKPPHHSVSQFCRLLPIRTSAVLPASSRKSPSSARPVPPLP